MNSSNMQPLKAQSGVREADEVGVLSAPRLEYNTSAKVLLSDSHKATAPLNPANIYQLLMWTKQ